MDTYRFGRFRLPTDHLSASSIAMFLRCERQYEYRYVHGIVLPASPAQMQGTVLHSALEYYYSMAVSGRRMTAVEAADAASAMYEDRLYSEETDMTPEEAEEGRTTVVRAVKAYVESVGSDVTPLSVEERFDAVSRCGVPIVGYLDLTFRHGNGIAIGDYKLTGKKWSLSDLKNSLQFNLYSHFTGIRNIQVHNIVKAPPKTAARRPLEPGITDLGQVRLLEHTFDGRDADFWERLIADVAGRITTGMFRPGDPSGWHCTPEACGYWGLCRGKMAMAA